MQWKLYESPQVAGLESPVYSAAARASNIDFGRHDTFAQNAAMNMNMNMNMHMHMYMYGWSGAQVQQRLSSGWLS